MEEKAIAETMKDDQFIEYCGVQVIYGETCSARVTIGPRHLNPYGIVHGGLFYTMADTATGVTAMKYMKDHPAPVSAPPMPTPINVIFNNPATIVYWSDGTKTVVKCQPGDTFSAEIGLTTAMLKKYMGNDNTFNRVINYWLKRTGNYNPALPVSKIPALPDATPPME